MKNPASTFTPLLGSVLAIVLAFTFGGCAHYQLGDGNTPAFHTIAFAPVVNNSYAPQAQALVSDALFRAFSQGGKVTVESNEHGAEVVLNVTLTEFKKLIGATKTNDTGSARSIVMILRAHATLIDEETGKPLYAGDFEISQDALADSGAVRAESEAMPKLAAALGEKIYRAVISKW